MADWPSSFITLPGGVIHSSSMCSFVTDLTLCHTHSNWTTATAWTTANRAIFLPFSLETTVTAYQMAVVNGATLGGNLDVGIYDVLGNRLVSKGSTAQTGTSVIQKLDITDTVLTPGVYFMAMATDSTTATYEGTGVVSGAGEQFRACGVQEQLSAFALPDPATFANPASTTTTIPSIAIALRSVI